MEDKNTTDAAIPKNVRPRYNAAATRQAIFDSARLAFTRFGYDGVGVREIAQNAGVTAMLVNRYFGSKEKLFEEVVEVLLSTPGVMRAEVAKPRRDPATLSRDMATSLVAKSAPGLSPDGILILLRSAGSKQAASILRANAMRYLAPLADLLPGGSPDVRAAICLSLISGFQLMRQVIALPALAETETDELVEQLAKLFETLTDGGAE